MLDRYLDPKQQLNRLREDYKSHNNLIIAVDFDNTLYDFHNVGDTYPLLISLLEKCYKLGLIITIFTSSKDHSLINSYLEDLNFKIYGINTSPVTSCSTTENLTLTFY